MNKLYINDVFVGNITWSEEWSEGISLTVRCSQSAFSMDNCQTYPSRVSKKFTIKSSKIEETFAGLIDAVQTEFEDGVIQRISIQFIEAPNESEITKKIDGMVYEDSNRILRVYRTPPKQDTPQGVIGPIGPIGQTGPPKQNTPQGVIGPIGQTGPPEDVRMDPIYQREPLNQDQEKYETPQDGDVFRDKDTGEFYMYNAKQEKWLNMVPKEPVEFNKPSVKSSTRKIDL
jgi:hypothetical protein